MLVAHSVYASEANSSNSNKQQIEVSITDNQTGETETVDSKYVDKKTSDGLETHSIESSNLIKSSNDSEIVEYEVFIPEEYFAPVNEEISPLVVDSGSRDRGGGYATLSVDYDWDNDGEIRVNRVFGGWETNIPEQLYVTNREVGVHSGTLYGEKLERTPTNNSFSYTTGWDYNYAVTGSAHSPRAWSSAVITGMGGSHSIEVEFTFPN